jgi:hypothetical protein
MNKKVKNTKFKKFNTAIVKKKVKSPPLDIVIHRTNRAKNEADILFTDKNPNHFKRNRFDLVETLIWCISSGDLSEDKRHLSKDKRQRKTLIWTFFNATHENELVAAKLNLVKYSQTNHEMAVWYPKCRQIFADTIAYIYEYRLKEFKSKEVLARQNRDCLIYVGLINVHLTEYIKNNSYKDNSVKNPIEISSVLLALNKLSLEKHRNFKNLHLKIYWLIAGKSKETELFLKEIKKYEDNYFHPNRQIKLKPNPYEMLQNCLKGFYKKRLIKKRQILAERNQACLVYIDVIKKHLTEYLTYECYIEGRLKGPIKSSIVLKSLNKLVHSWETEKRLIFKDLHSKINKIIACKPKEVERFQKTLNNWVKSPTDPDEKLRKVFNNFILKWMKEQKRIADESQACLVYIDAIMESLTKFIRNNSVENPINGPIILDGLNKLLSILRSKNRKVYANLHKRIAGVFTAKYYKKLMNQVLSACISLRNRVNSETQKPRLVHVKKEIIAREFIYATRQLGFLNIIYSKRNIFATVSDFRGEILGTTTTGLLKAGRGRRRNLLLNIKKTATNTVNIVFKSKLTDLVLVQKGKTFNKKKRTFKKIVLKGTTKGGKIFTDLVRPVVREHNGSRPVKVRRR